MDAIEMNQISGKQFIEKLAKAIADNMQISQTKEEDKSNEQAAVSPPAVVADIGSISTATIVRPWAKLVASARNPTISRRFV